MTVFLTVWLTIVAAIVGLALLLPCKGCQLRRERMRRAYDDWKRSRGGKD